MVERVEYDDNGFLDEVVAHGGVHLESLDSDHDGGTSWFLSIKRADGTSLCVWIEGRITLSEEREPGKWWLSNRKPCPKCQGTGEVPK